MYANGCDLVNDGNFGLFLDIRGLLWLHMGVKSRFGHFVVMAILEKTPFALAYCMASSAVQ